MANSVIGRDMAVDLGTANTLVYVRGRGVVLDEPSVVALNAETGELLAAGRAAKQMLGRTPEAIRTVRPLREGVIGDLGATELMLRHFIAQVHRRRYFVKPRLVICLPSGLPRLERRAVEQVGYAAGARQVSLVEESMAAAMGADLPVHEATGNMVVDIGGGTTEVAVISLGGVVTHRSARIGGDRLDQRLVEWLAKEHELAVGEHTAEQVKLTLGSAYPLVDELEADVRGRDLSSGLPRTITLFSTEVRRALEDPVREIVDAVRVTLDQTPPELAGDILDRGLVLTGGGALLRGLDQLLRAETGMPVHVAEAPLTSVVLGAGKCVEEYEDLKQVLVSSEHAAHAQQPAPRQTPQPNPQIQQAPQDQERSA